MADGADPRPFTQRRFSRYFPEASAGPLPVRLIARRPPNTRCFAKDDGVDAPRDTFTIRVFQGLGYHLPVAPFAAPHDDLRNLGRGCQSPYFGIGLTWRGFFSIMGATNLAT